MKKESVLTGAAILTFSSLLSRLTGFYYRIYMTKAIGSEGVGLYQLIMSVYLLAWTITSSGITSTVSTLSAKYCSQNRYKESLGVLKSDVLLTLSLSILIEAALLLFAPFIAESVLKDQRAILPLRIISLCFPFMSVGSSVRGYFYGTKNTKIPAASQITEQLVRVFSVMAMFTFFEPKSLSSACSIAAAGIVFGEAVSFIFTIAAFKKLKPKSKKASPSDFMPTVIKSALPLSAGRILGSFLSAAENILIPQKLILYGCTESNALSLYGKLTGMAMPLIQFPTSILMSFSTALSPAISSAATLKESKKLKDAVKKSICLSSAVGIWAMWLFAFFSKHCSSLLYNQASLGAMIVKLAPLCPFLYLNITLTSILNGIGRQKTIFINNMLSSVINLFFINFLMPSFGINAFIFGLFASLFVSFVISLSVICFSTKVKPNIKNTVLKPLLCGFLSGIIKFLPFGYSEISIILSLSLFSLMYIAFLFLTGAFKLSSLKPYIRLSKKQT